VNLARQRRSVAHVALVCAAIALCAAWFASEARSSESPDQLRARLGRLDASKSRALLELFSAQTALANAQARALEAHRSVLIAGANLARARALLAGRLRELYRNGNPDELAVVLGASSLSDALDGIDLLRRSAANDATMVSDVQSGKRTAERLLVRATADEKELAVRTEQQRQLLADLRTQARLTSERIAQLEAAARAAQTRADATARRIARERAQQPSSGSGDAGSGGSGSGGGSGGGGSGGGGSGGGGSGGGGSGGGAPVSGGGTLTVEATAYDDTGSTASGIPAGPGFCATDWSVIPQGTRFYVPGYGECIAADTGGAIVGDRIDVWIGDPAAVDNWGRRTVTITFL
jgi:3D (Asp-Asp-Asp) domain-containing protein